MNVEIALAFAQAFCTYLEGGTIALARDSRPSGLLIRSAVLSGLLAGGSRVVDLGIIPSPTVRIFFGQLGADGAVIVAAGHNPSHWNALKFLGPSGTYLSALQGEELLEIYSHGEFQKADWRSIQPIEFNHSALDCHRRRILETFDVPSIRRRKFKVAVDCCNGPCARITPRLLEDLGCQVVAFNTDLKRPMPHYPNPTPDNMTQLEALVSAARADVGFAHDAEGERLGIVTDQGRALSQEHTLALACLIALRSGRSRGPVVTNLSTSRMIDEVAERFGVRTYRTAVGQAHVTEKTLQVKADLAGEGSGQVILPWLHPGPDGMAAIALTLEYLARSDSSLSQLAHELPAFHMIKESLPFPPDQLYRRLQRIRIRAGELNGDYRLDLTDGVKVENSDEWLQVRASSTESLLRIIAEAREKDKAVQLHRWAREVVLE